MKNLVVQVMLITLLSSSFMPTLSACHGQDIIRIGVFQDWRVEDIGVDTTRPRTVCALLKKDTDWKAELVKLRKKYPSAKIKEFLTHALLSFNQEGDRVSIIIGGGRKNIETIENQQFDESRKRCKALLTIQLAAAR